MTTTLLYILMALPHGQWRGSFEVHATTDHQRCEAIKMVMDAAPKNGNVYSCHTLVKP